MSTFEHLELSPEGEQPSIPAEWNLVLIAGAAKANDAKNVVASGESAGSPHGQPVDIEKSPNLPTGFGHWLHCHVGPTKPVMQQRLDRGECR